MNLRPILTLIEEAKRWRLQHKAAGRTVEALAASLRIRALQDALAAMEKSNG